MRSRARPLLSTRMATRRGVSAAAKLQVQEEVVDDADMADELRRSATLLSATAVGMLLPSGLALADNPEVVNPFFTFSPVCPASDGIFRVGQRAALGIAGTDNIEDYRPLINDVLIRVRTELCVLESFVRETATPFIQQKGVRATLPLTFPLLHTPSPSTRSHTPVARWVGRRWGGFCHCTKHRKRTLQGWCSW